MPSGRKLAPVLLGEEDNRRDSEQWPLSQRLEAFYQTAPASGQNQRFHSFCRASHCNLASNALDAAARPEFAIRSPGSRAAST